MRIAEQAAKALADHAHVSISSAAVALTRYFGGAPQPPPGAKRRRKSRYRNAVEGVDLVGTIDHHGEGPVLVAVRVRSYTSNTASVL